MTDTSINLYNKALKYLNDQIESRDIILYNGKKIDISHNIKISDMVKEYSENNDRLVAASLLFGILDGDGRWSHYDDIVKEFDRDFANFVIKISYDIDNYSASKLNWLISTLNDSDQDALLIHLVNRVIYSRCIDSMEKKEDKRYFAREAQHAFFWSTDKKRFNPKHLTLLDELKNNIYPFIYEDLIEIWSQSDLLLDLNKDKDIILNKNK